MSSYLNNQMTKLLKSPSSKIKHTRDDSSLDKTNKYKSVQSGRRITTQQGNKICQKVTDNLKKKLTDSRLHKQTSKNNIHTQNSSGFKIDKYSSCKNLKNLKLSMSSNKKIQSYFPFFSPKNKNISHSNILKQKDLFSKSTLKKVGGKANLSSKVNKTIQQQNITPFIVNQNVLKSSINTNKNTKKLQLKNTGQKLQKSLKLNDSHSKQLKTLQNQHIKHRDSNKRQKDTTITTKKSGKPKIYHQLKMKTEHSMISCQSTPSDIFMHDIELLQLVGEGTFGKVYKAMIKKTLEIIAIKRVYQDKKYKNREIEIVSMLNSNFTMRVLGTYITYEQPNKQYLNIAMKYYESDLYKEINKKKYLSTLEIKVYVYQIFRGLLYIHSKNICHRDIKPHNILINKLSLALCDFGSAKILNPEQKNLPYICSRCYRAPQLIFGSTQYTTMIDIWSVGCVILEMIHGTPFFIGNSSIDHLIQVIKVLGTPTKTQVKEMNPQYDLKDYKFPNIKSKSLAKLFPNADPLLISLLQQIMIYAPKQRLNAAQALVHEFFDELRQEKTYEKLCQQYDLPDFFDFTPEQMKDNQHLYGQLVPSWYCKNHFTYFQDEQIEKNNTLKFYYD